MTELFVTYDIARKLREIGYHEPCVAFFDTYDDHLFIPSNNKYQNNHKFDIPKDYNSCEYPDMISAPLLLEVLDWLEKEFNIKISYSKVYQNIETIYESFVYDMRYSIDNTSSYRLIESFNKRDYSKSQSLILAIDRSLKLI